MAICFKKGLRRAFGFYAAGVSIILVLHFFIGRDNPYTPPFSIILFTLLLVCGLPWLALNVVSVFKSSARQQSLGEITIHLLMYSISMVMISLWMGAL